MTTKTNAQTADLPFYDQDESLGDFPPEIDDLDGEDEDGEEDEIDLDPLLLARMIANENDDADSEAAL